VRLISEGSYRAESWERKRRVIYKAEAMEEGHNTRFVVTNKTQGPEKLYDSYVRRGESENRISRTSRWRSKPTGSVAAASLPTRSGCFCTRRLTDYWTCC
jgi:hypothetical protein